MTDKELTQIEAWLSGQGRYKLFDTQRLSVLRELDGNEFKVWFYLWTQERGRQESWVKNETIAKETGVSLSTVKRVRKRLIGNQWVIYTGSTAADNYDNPTPGARLVRSVRVDDPTKGQIDPLGQNEPEGANLNRVNLTPNVSTASTVSTAVAFASTSMSTLTSTCTRNEVHKDDDSLRSSEKQKPETEEPKTPKRSRAEAKAKSEAKWLETYGEPKPDWFDEAASTPEGQLRRTKWCGEAKVRLSKAKRLAIISGGISRPDEVDTPAESVKEPTPTHAIPSRRDEDEEDTPIFTSTTANWCYTCGTPKSKCMCIRF